MNQYRRKKYIFVFRLFTGLYCLKDNLWQPTGSPAVYKLLEYLDKRGVDSEVFLLCKSIENSDGIKRTKRIQLKNFNSTTFTIVPYRRFTSIIRINSGINSIIHLAAIIKSVIRNKPDIVYVDRTNMYIGAFFSLFRKPKVVLRMLGVLDYLNFYRNKINALRHPVRYFSVKAPFSYIICTKDGSPAKKLLQEYINKRSRYSILLNGIDKQSTSLYQKKEPAVTGQKIKILFIARLEYDKGILELIEAFRVLSTRYNGFYLNVIGGGSLEARIKDTIQSYNLASRIFVKGELPHKDTLAYYQDSDIFISLNKKGNLNNTVLEAISARACLVILDKSDDGIDQDTDTVIPAGYAVRVARQNTAEDLCKKISHLLENPYLIERYKRQSQEIASKIMSWQERLRQEEIILEQLVSNRNAVS